MCRRLHICGFISCWIHEICNSPVQKNKRPFKPFRQFLFKFLSRRLRKLTGKPSRKPADMESIDFPNSLIIIQITYTIPGRKPYSSLRPGAHHVLPTSIQRADALYQNLYPEWRPNIIQICFETMKFEYTFQLTTEWLVFLIIYHTHIGSSEAGFIFRQSPRTALKSNFLAASFLPSLSQTQLQTASFILCLNTASTPK